MTDLYIDTERPHSSGNAVLPILIEKLISIVGFLFSIIISEKLIDNLFFGGAVFIGGQLVMLSGGVFGKQGKALMPRQEKVKYLIFIPIAVVIFGCLLILYPLLAGNKNVIFLLLFIVLQFVGFYLFEGTPLVLPKNEVKSKHYVSHFVAILLAASILFIWSPDIGVNWLILAYFIISSVLMTIHRLLKPRSSTFERSNPGQMEGSSQTVGDMLKVYSYKLYWNMTANMSVALEISMLMLVCYLPLLPLEGFWTSFADAAVLVALYFIAAAVAKLILKKKRLRELGKNSVFITFSIIWIMASLYIYENSTRLSTLGFCIVYSLLCICITALASVIISMDSDMQIIGALGIKHFTVNKYNILKALMHNWSMFISRFAILIVISFLTFFTEYNTEKGIGELHILGKYGLTFLPVLFLMLGVLSAIRQPLTKYYEQKLKKYIKLKGDGKLTRAIEERLKLVLVEKYSKRLGIRLLMVLLKPFFSHKVIGRKNIDTKTFPAIFVCNHSEVYGPIAALLNIPFYIRPWILNDMIDTEKISEHIQHGTFDRQRWLPDPLRKRAGSLIGPIVAWAMHSMEPIPVYRHSGREILKVISLSIDALEADDNILIFPENPFKTNGYVREGVGEFFSGFVNIAKEYYRKTGRTVTFYSVFANKKKRTISFSEGVTFNPGTSFREEKERITKELHRAMRELSN